MRMTGKWTAVIVLALLTALFLGCAVTAEAGTEISVVKVTCDETKLQLNTAYTEGEIGTRFRTSAGISTAGCSLDLGNSGVWYTVGSSWYGIGDGTAQVSTDKKYAYHYTVKLSDGYSWNSKIKACTSVTNVADCAGLTVYLNGTKRTDVTFRYNAYWDHIELHIPTPAPSTKPIVTKVDVWGDGLSMAYGTSHTFRAVVRGTLDDTVKWTVKGAKSSGTKITSAGLLTVAANETAKTLTIRAAASSDSTKYGEISINVGAFKQITKIALTYDAAGLHLSTDSTEGEVNQRMKGSIGITSAGCTVYIGNLLIFKDGNFVGVGEGTAQVDPDKQYYFAYQLQLSKGYAWSEGTLNSPWNGWVKLGSVADLGITANGAAWSNVYISYNPGAHVLNVFIPAPSDLPEIDFTKAKVTGVVAKTYTGKVIRQDPTVTLNGKTLVKGTDYKITYTNNKNAGKATMKLTGLGRYKGVITKQFTIKPVKIGKAVLEYTSKVYTGKYLKPKATVTATVDGAVKTLKSGTDYTLTYEDNKNAGTAKVTVQGQGNYYGKIVKKFTIKPVKIAKVTLEYTKTKYTGKALKPAVTVTATVNGETVTLKKTRDYTVTYADNKNVGTATVTVTGVGNFKGTIVKTFKIVK